MASILSIDGLRSVVLPLLKQYGLKRALLFGSYARGEASDNSDIDLIVERGADSRRLSVYALGEDVREARASASTSLTCPSSTKAPSRARSLMRRLPYEEQ